MRRTTKGAEVAVNSRVTIRRPDSSEVEVFQLVNEKDADVSANRISVRCLLGQAILGKRVGDTVEYLAPIGLQTVEILKVEA